MSIALAIVITIVVITLSMYLLWQARMNYLLEGLKSINGPINYPFVGGILEVLPASESLWKLEKMQQKYGKTWKMAVPYTVGLCTTELDFIEHIMTSTKCVNKSSIYRFLGNWLGDGLLISSSNKWRQRRKMITPAFHFKILEHFVEIFNKNEKILVDLLTKQVEKQSTVDVFNYITLCSLDNINETAMGTSMNAQLNGNSDFVEATKMMSDLLYKRMASPYKFLDIIYGFMADSRIEKKCVRILHNYSLTVIKARRDELLKNKAKTLCNDDNDNFGIKGRTVFLDLLLQSTINGQPLSNEDIQEEVDTFMFEGHDTISAAISFTLYCISKYPNVQSIIIDEQREIYDSNPTRNTTMKDMNSMCYLEMVIKESLRLYPSVPGIARIAMEDFQYRNLHIRKTTELLIPIYAVHKNPEIFPEPEKFDPERFSTENQKKRHPFAFLPFSAGHRNCIGQKFAMLELKSTISRVLRHFELSAMTPEHKFMLPSAIVLHASNGVYMNFKKRVW